MAGATDREEDQEATVADQETPPTPDTAGKSSRQNQRDLQKAETRRRLLDSATQVFTEQGPMSASLEEIAARAGVSRPTLIFHFGSRADLMDAVVLYHLEHFRRWGADYRPGELRPFVEAFLRAQANPVVRLVWMLWSLAHPDGVRSDHAEGLNRSYWHRFAQLDERIAQSAGVSQEEAHRRTVVIAPALLLMAQRAAQDLTSESELHEFIETVCQCALARGPWSANGPGVPEDGTTSR